MSSCRRVTQRFDVDVSLKDFPTTSSETVLPFLPLSPSPVFVLSLLFTSFGGGMEIFLKEKQKVQFFFWIFKCLHTVTGGQTGAHIIRETGLSLCVWGPIIQSNPSCICQFSNLINYHQQTLQYQQLVDSTDVSLINSWLIRKSPYQQLVVDKELIVDKVVLINKES